MENTQTLFGALSKAQGSLKTVVKNAANAFNKSTYADIGQIVRSISDSLEEHGLSITHLVCINGDNFFLESRLCHKDGGYLVSNIPLLMPKRDMQSLGAAITYARRYNCMALLNLGISDKSDDDGVSLIAATENRETLSKDQIDKLKEAFNGDKALSDKLLLMFGVLNWSTLKSSDFNKCIELITLEKRKTHDKD